jgi:hypothetical protein
MKQATLNLHLKLKKTRKQVFLEQMEQVVPWADLIALIGPYYPEGKNGCPPFPLMTMLRTHFMQQWFTLSDPAMEEAFFDTPLYRDFAQLEEFARMPDESTILRFRHRLEEHKLADQILITVNDLLTAKGLLLKAGTVVDATLIAAPTSTKNKDRTRDPDMHSSKKGNQWSFGMIDKAEKLKASVRANVEHPFRVIKRQFGFVDGARQIDGGATNREKGPRGRGKRSDFGELLVKFHYLNLPNHYSNWRAVIQSIPCVDILRNRKCLQRHTLETLNQGKTVTYE